MSLSTFSSSRLGAWARTLALGGALLGAASVRADTTGITGSNTSFNTAQPTTALTWMICVSGMFPSRDGGSTSEDAILGEIRLLSYDGGGNIQGWLPCNGQTLSVLQNQALFSLLGTSFGGNGSTTFMLPDLRGRVPIGAGQGSGLTNRVLGEKAGSESTTLTTANLPSHAHTITGGTTSATGSFTPVDNMQPYLALNFCIEYGGTFDFTGWVRIFAFSYAPSGMYACNGGQLPLQPNLALFSKLGTNFGGDGVTTFAVPDLRGRTPIGEGAAASGSTYTLGGTGGVEAVELLTTQMPAHTHSYSGGTTGSAGGGQAHNTMQPYLVLHPLLATDGIYQGMGSEPAVGEVRWMAGGVSQLKDRGWLDCDGRLQQVLNLQALYSLVGATFGGNGQDTFGVPQLVGRATAHIGAGSGLTNRTLGAAWGAETVTLTTGNLPAHTHSYIGVPAPTVTSISPTAGTTSGGTTVTITGTNFTGATGVTFGPTLATAFTVDSATQITATAPANAAGTVDVRVTTSGGTSSTSASDQFTYSAPDTTAPTVVSVTRKSPSAQSTNATSVTFTVTYSEAVTGVTTSSFAVQAVNSSNIVGSVTSVTGSGATRDVAVSVTSGSGEFTLKVVQ